MWLQKPYNKHIANKRGITVKNILSDMHRSGWATTMFDIAKTVCPSLSPTLGFIDDESISVIDAMNILAAFIAKGYTVLPTGVNGTAHYGMYIADLNYKNVGVALCVNQDDSSEMDIWFYCED